MTDDLNSQWRESVPDTLSNSNDASPKYNLSVQWTQYELEYHSNQEIETVLQGSDAVVHEGPIEL